METCRSITEHVLQYSCSKCNTVLRESDSPLGDVSKTSEMCPTCGIMLVDTLQVQKPVLQKNNARVQLQTAYELTAKLTFDIAGMDRLAALAVGDHACIIGNRHYANLLLTRLLVRALMPQRYGGLGSQHVLCIDAGNCTNGYQCVNFARQYGMEIKPVLRSIILSRAFTIYQLAGVIVHKLPQLIQQFNTKIVVISDLLKMFVEDSTVKSHVARYLLREIMKAIDRLPKDILVLASLYSPASKYDELVQTRFEKRIRLSEFAIPDTDLRLVSVR